MRNSPRLMMAGVLVALAVACGDSITMPQASDIQPAFTHVAPTFVSGNVQCVSTPPSGLPGLGYQAGFKPFPEPPPSGTYTSGDGLLTVTITSDDTYFDWTATEASVQAVIVKGGPNANVYVYDPPAKSAGDTGLHSPINPSTGRPYDISHIEFCYNRDFIILNNLEVNKTAATEKDRDWTWVIEKTADQTNLLLSAGQLFKVNYKVDVDASSTDTNVRIYGEITATNGNPQAGQTIQINSVDDVVAPGFPADVDCGVTFPHVLDAGESLTCSYEADSWGAGTSGENEATVSATVGALTDDFPAFEDWDFADATIRNETDRCADISDTNVVGLLGTVCADAVPASFMYSLWFGAHANADVVLECGENRHVNTASFETNDTPDTGSDDHTVTATVDCQRSCTLTPGYWKTHSKYGPAPYDDTWALVPGYNVPAMNGHPAMVIPAAGEDTRFFRSSMSYYQALWTPPVGNAYWILAHAYIAAQLNGLNGTDLTAVQAAFNAATALFNKYTPAQAAALRASHADRQAFINNALILDAYNNGLRGTPHCSE